MYVISFVMDCTLFLNTGTEIHSLLKMIMNIYCSLTLLIYLFLGFAGVSNGQLIAIHFGFKNVNVCSEPLMIGRRGCSGRD